MLFRSVDQQFTRLITTLESPIGGASVLTSKFNEAGYLLSTTDTTDGSGSTTTYLIKENGEPLKVTNRAVSAGGRQELEEHNWMYKDNLPQSMLRIKNTTDTTFVWFVADEKGNVAEENSTRNGLIIPSYYYYYDENNRLTDIVSYNIKAKRLLPAYVFDYNEDGSLKSMMVVPEGSSDYQKWYYKYEQGLKVKETVFNKKKQLLGTIKYDYE